MPVAAVPTRQASVALGACVRNTRADQQIAVEVQVQRYDVVIREVAVLSPVVGDIASEAVDHQNAEVVESEVKRVAVDGHGCIIEVVRTERLPRAEDRDIEQINPHDTGIGGRDVRDAIARSDFFDEV